MAFKVAVERVNLLPHPNADSLDLVGIGDSQYVVQKGLYEDQDLAVAVSKGALLTHPILLTEWEKYLQGPDKNIVGSVTLRGQESEGIIIRDDILAQMGFDIKSFEVSKDISGELGITKFIPAIPEVLKGTVEVYHGPLVKSIEHDCKYPVVYANRFTKGEPITITSKIHGSQINIIWAHDKDSDPVDKRLVFSSKGLWQQGLVFKEDADNLYTQAWHNFMEGPFNSVSFWQTLSDMIKADIFDQQVQIIGEVVPAIKGFNYGHTKPTIYIYSIYINGVYTDLSLLRRLPKINIVPELFKGTYDDTTLDMATLFAEQPVCPIDGTTINEGVVVSNGKHHIKTKNTRFVKKHGKDETT